MGRKRYAFKGVGSVPGDTGALREQAQSEAPERPSFGLSAGLIEGFVMEYLHSKYDKPQPIPDFHREAWGACASDESHVLILAPRGHAKSTAITEGYGLAALLFRQRDFAVILSNTWQQSVEFLGDLKLELLENDKLREDFGIKRLLKDREDDLICLMQDGYKFRVVARGAEQKVRGLKWNKRRPNLVLFDDLEDDEQVLNVERRTKFSNWFFRAVLPFGSDDCLFRGSATILHFDSLAQNLSKSEEWKTLRYRAHKSFTDFSEILWPTKFNEARLRGIQRKYLAKGDRDGYSQEYLNQPIAEGSSFFRVEDLQEATREELKQPLRFFCAWDFAISKKQGADYTVCVVVGINVSHEIFVVDVRRDRWDSKEIIDEMFSVYAAWHPEVFYAEAGQIEKVLGPFIYDEMRRKETFFNLEPRTPVLDKVSRAAAWRAITRAKRVKYDKEASWYGALEEEMTQFPKGVNDDQVDPQSLLGMEIGNLLPANTRAEQEEEEYEEKFGRANAHREVGRDAVAGY